MPEQARSAGRPSERSERLERLVSRAARTLDRLFARRIASPIPCRRMPLPEEMATVLFVCGLKGDPARFNAEAFAELFVGHHSAFDVPACHESLGQQLWPDLSAKPPLSPIFTAARSFTELAFS